MNLRHATLHQLRIFQAVAEHNSFARAAEALHLSPPTLSLQVKQLADTVGQPLFEQLGKKIFLTAAGKTLAQACQDIAQRMDLLGEDLAALQGMERGSLKLAILTTVKYTVPKLLGGFCAAHPGIDVAMVVGNRENLLQRLASNQDDLYIMGQPPQHVDVVCEAFADNPLVLVAPPSHPLVGKRRIDPARLRQEPFILREPGSGTRLTMERFFAEQGFSAVNRLEVGSNEAIKQTVRAAWAWRCCRPPPWSRNWRWASWCNSTSRAFPSSDVGRWSTPEASACRRPRRPSNSGSLTIVPVKQSSLAADLVKRQFTATGINQLWVADMTYVPTWVGFLYLAVVVDVYSRKVVGWAFGERMTSDLVVAALNMVNWPGF